MPAKLNLTGGRFGRMTVIGPAAPLSYGKSYWTCKCDCGGLKVVVGSDLHNGYTKSCGCLTRECSIERFTTHGFKSKAATRLQRLTYAAWQSMIGRCHNPRNKRYADWGGRGIVVCQRWLDSFENFVADVGIKPFASASIDRYPNNDGNYEPGNVRWASPSQQRCNQRGYERYAEARRRAQELVSLRKQGFTYVNIGQQFQVSGCVAARIIKEAS